MPLLRRELLRRGRALPGGREVALPPAGPVGAWAPAARIVREALVPQIEKGRSAPKRKRLVAVALLREPLESLRVELALLDSQQVPGIPCHQPTVPELLAQVRYGVLKDLRGSGRGA